MNNVRKHAPNLVRSAVLATVVAAIWFTQPTQAQLTPEQAGEAALDVIERRAAQIKTYEAKMRYDQIQALQGDEQTRFGTLYYNSGPPVSFCVDFTAIVIDKQLRQQDRAWIFDGIWLVEKVSDKKQFIKRQVVDPVKQKNFDPMSIDSSPFPIPIRAKKDEVLRRFQVTLMPVAADDPANSFRLKLIPRPNSSIAFSEISLWYDKQSQLPVRAHTIKEDSGDEQIFNLFNAKVNEPIPTGKIDTTTPDARDWTVTITPLED